MVLKKGFEICPVLKYNWFKQMTLFQWLPWSDEVYSRLSEPTFMENKLKDRNQWHMIHIIPVKCSYLCMILSLFYGHSDVLVISENHWKIAPFRYLAARKDLLGELASLFPYINP